MPTATALAYACFCVCALVVEVESSVESQYPLLHIGDKLNCTHSGTPCVKDNGADGDVGFAYAPTDSDAAALASFALRHISFEDPSDARALVARLHAAGGGPLVKYTETRPVCGGSSGQVTPFVVDCNSTTNFETGGFRHDARVYHAANLTAAITVGDTALEVCLVDGIGGKLVTALVASTAQGNYSDYDGTAFVFWVRLRDELLKVTSVSASRKDGCQTLEVQRGLDGTEPGAFPVGEPVLAPTLVGGLPTASGALPFIAEYTSFYAWSSIANFTVDAVQQQGVDGAWFDSFSPGIREQDLGGQTVAVWNVSAMRPLTASEAFAGQVQRLNAVWARVHALLPHATIWANNFETWFPYNDTDGNFVPGDRSFVVPAAAQSVGLNMPFSGASLEAWTAQFTCGCFAQLGFAKDSDVTFVTESNWVAHVNSLLDAAAANVSLAAMVGSAGCQSQLQVYLDSRKQLDALHYASFLMGVTSEGGTPAAASGPLLGTSAYFAQDEDTGSWPVGIGVAAVNTLYTLSLGAPMTFVADAADYLIAPAVYARWFASALVLVNPTPTDASGPTLLNGTYYDATGIDPSAPVVSVHMTAHTGRILLTSPPPGTLSG